MTKRPAFQFYPKDWRNDAALQSCSIGARGLWLECMNLMHECDPYGHLVVNGKPMDADKAARLCGVTRREYDRLLKELADAGVPGFTDDGIMYSRRMVRDEQTRNARARGGQLGAEHGIKGAEHGTKGGRPRVETGDKKPPLQAPLKPPPSSSSASASADSKEPRKEARADARSAPKGTRWFADVPETWLTDADIQRHEHDLPRIDLRLEAVRFKNYWSAKTGKDATKLDWHATWINWALDDSKRKISKVSAHDKGTEGAALFLAEVERGNGSGHRNGAGTAGAGPRLLSSGHGLPEMGDAVPDLLRGPQGRER